MFIKKFTYTQEYVTSPSEINYEDLLYPLKSPPFQLTKNQYCINVVSTKEGPGEHGVQRWAARPSTSGQRSRAPQTVYHWQYSAGGKELTSHFESSLINIQKALADVEGRIRA